MIEHKKEPWSEPEYDNCEVRGSEWWEIPGVGRTYTEEDARRIVACVNACTGFKTEELEKIAQSDDGLRTYSHETVRAIAEQRGELLSALKDVCEMYVFAARLANRDGAEFDTAEDLRDARKAIAKSEGRA